MSDGDVVVHMTTWQLQRRAGCDSALMPPLTLSESQPGALALLGETMPSNPNDLYAQNQRNLREQNAALVAKFDAACAALGIGEAGGGETVPTPPFMGEPAGMRPRFEAKCEIRDGVFVEFKVADHTVPRNGYQTDATWRPSFAQVEGGTVEARALVEELRRRLAE
jgi:hypothetical protein